MARKKYEEEPDHHERWLVSYADFMTLLFAFFVVMYTVSSVNEGKYRILSGALGSAFGKTPVVIPPIAPERSPNLILPLPTMSRQRANDAVLRREKEQLTNIARDILDVLAPLVQQGKVRVTQNSRGVSVEINASVLFAPGEAKLTAESSQALTAVARVIKADTHAIQVEGHTDNLPISNALFPSNWELSAVRASSVVRLFVDEHIDEARLVAVGHGSNLPVQPNTTAEGRQRNRRVELMILSSLPDVITELPVEASKSIVVPKPSLPAPR